MKHGVPSTVPVRVSRSAALSLGELVRALREGTVPDFPGAADPPRRAAPGFAGEVDEPRDGAIRAGTGS